VDFLNFQSTFPLEVNLLLGQLILPLVQLGFQLIKPSTEISLLFSELLSLGCEIFYLSLQLLSQRLPLIFKSSISALLSVFLGKQLNFLVQLSSFRIELVLEGLHLHGLVVLLAV
jgi:hypothetical protein